MQYKRGRWRFLRANGETAAAAAARWNSPAPPLLRWRNERYETWQPWVAVSREGKKTSQAEGLGRPRGGGGGVGGKKDPKRAVSKTGKALQAREHGHLRQPQHTRRRGRPATAKQGGKRVVRVVRASLRRASFVDVVDARRQFPSRFCCCLMLFFVRHSLMITSSVPCVFSS